MTPTVTPNYPRPVVGAASIAISLLLLLLVVQKMELARVQTERDVAISTARDLKRAYDREYRKQMLQFMLNKTAAGKGTGTKKRAAVSAVVMETAIALPVAVSPQSAVMERSVAP